jgi:phospholipase A1/A2
MMPAWRQNPTAGLLLAITLAVHGPDAMAQTPQDCAAIKQDDLRLSCYDALYKTAPVSTSVEQAVPSTARSRASFLERQWQLGVAQSDEVLRPSAYKPVYVFPVSVTDSVNNLPGSPAAGRSLTGSGIGLQPTELVFQLSFKSKLWHRVLNAPVDLWAGYTQRSYWQLYNGDISRPFRETNYEPELMLTTGLKQALLGGQLRMLGLSLNHQSNGRPLPLSRSWNRVILMAGWEYNNWTVMLRPWWRIPESAGNDDNPDIADFVGRMEARAQLQMTNQHSMAFSMRHSMRSGDRARGGFQLEYAWPLWSDLQGRVHLFHGYGENLIDYNLRQTRLSVGVSLGQW